jgi:oxygen-independent coproporphyrinogen-3 oxidase
LPCDDEVVDLYYWSIDFLAQHGFNQYEISNFARDGYHSRHNSCYWERTPYKGFGLGACSFDGVSRFQNEKNLMNYMKRAQENEDTVVMHETLTPAHVRVETIMLGIRRTTGVAMEAVFEGLTPSQSTHVQATIRSLANNGFIAVEGDRLRLLARGISVENEIALQLLV